MRGVRINIWKQDPWVPHVSGTRPTYIHTPVSAGPSDAELKIVLPDDLPPIKPDEDGNFLFHRDKDPRKFDVAHTFAVARQVLTTYQRSLKRVGYSKPFSWQWGRSPLVLDPFGMKDEESAPVYQRHARRILFSTFEAKGYSRKNGGEVDKETTEIRTCQSFDFIAHEMGHAILDGFKPGYGDSSSEKTTELSEAFADLAALFTLLSQMDMVEHVIALTGAQIDKPSFLNEIAERYGDVVKRDQYGLRNFYTTYEQADSQSPYERSQGFSTAIYAILSHIFEDHRHCHQYDPAESLYRVGRHLMDVVVSAYLEGPGYNPSPADIAALMVNGEENPHWRNIMKVVFENAGILAPYPGK